MFGQLLTLPEDKEPSAGGVPARPKTCMANPNRLIFLLNEKTHCQRLAGYSGWHSMGDVDDLGIKNRGLDGSRLG